MFAFAALLGRLGVCEYEGKMEGLNCTVFSIKSAVKRFFFAPFIEISQHEEFAFA